MLEVVRYVNDSMHQVSIQGFPVSSVKSSVTYLYLDFINICGNQFCKFSNIYKFEGTYFCIFVVIGSNNASVVSDFTLMSI